MLDAYETTIPFAKQIAIEKKKYAVSPACFFLALLQTQELPESVISKNQKNHLIELLGKEVNKDFSFEEFIGTVPNHQELAEIVNHARFFKNELYESKISTKHLLLAVLTFDNVVSTAFSKRGIIYDDIASMDNRKKQFLLNLKRPPQIPLDFQIDYSDAQIAAFSEKTITDQLKIAEEYAWKYSKYNDFEECKNCCNYMVRLNPAHEIAYYILGVCQYNQKQYEKAIDSFKRIADTSAHYKHAAVMINSVYAKQKKYDLAKKEALKRLEKEPSNCNLLNTIGFYLAELNDYEQAIPYLQKSIDLDEDPHPYAYDNLGYCYFLKGEFEEAIELIEHSLTLDKGNSFGYKNLALVYLSLNDKLKAIDNLLLAKRFGFREKYGNEVEEMFDMLMQEKEQQKTASTFTRKLFNLFKRN